MKDYNFAHIATQNDKVIEAFETFNMLLDSMPEAQANFNLAKQSTLNNLRTQRIKGQSVISSFLNDRLYARPSNSMQHYYTALQGINFDNIKEFNRKKFHKAHRTYVVLGNKEQVDMEALKKFGKVKELTLEEIFGY